MPDRNPTGIVNVSGFWPHYAAVRLVYPPSQAYLNAKWTLRAPAPSLLLSSEKFANHFGKKSAKKVTASFA